MSEILSDAKVAAIGAILGCECVPFLRHVFRRRAMLTPFGIIIADREELHECFAEAVANMGKQAAYLGKRLEQMREWDDQCGACAKRKEREEEGE